MLFLNVFLLTGIVSSMSLPAWKFIYICILIVGEYLPFYLSFIYQRQLIFDVADVSGCFEAAGCAKTQALICLLKCLNNSVWFLFFFCYLSYFTIHTFISYLYLHFFRTYYPKKIHIKHFMENRFFSNKVFFCFCFLNKRKIIAKWLL